MNGCFQANIPLSVRPTSLLPSTQPGFRGLRRWSELFLFRTRTLAPAPSLPGIRAAAFGVRQDLTGGEALASYRSLYLRGIVPRLHLNAFRGVRAISEFDWPFTPTHRSSGKLFNAYRFGPPTCVTTSSSCPCVDHSVSRLPPATLRPVRTRFRSGSESGSP